MSKQIRIIYIILNRLNWIVKYGIIIKYYERCKAWLGDNAMVKHGVRYTNIIDIDIDKIQINPGDTVRLNFDVKSAKDLLKKDLCLRINGGTGILGDKNEWRKFSLLTASISDSIEGEYLVIGSSTKNKQAYYKAYSDEIKDARNLTLKVKYTNTSVSGKVLATLNIYYKSDLSKTAYSAQPDIIRELKLSYNEIESELSVSIRAEEEIDFIIVSLSATNIDGVVKIASPQLLRSSGENLIEPFSILPSGENFPRWIGENLSKIEWNHFILRLNGTLIFDGEKFDNGLKENAYEIPLKADKIKNGENIIDLTYQASYPSQPSINLQGARVVITPQEGIVGFGRYARIGKYPVAIKLREATSLISAECDKAGISLDRESLIHLDEGLNIIQFDITEPFVGSAKISLKINGASYRVTIARFIEKYDDILFKSVVNTIASSDREQTERMLENIFRNNIGNLLELNNSYRSTGGYKDSQEFEKVLNLLARSHIKFFANRSGCALGESETNNLDFPENMPNFVGFAAKDMDKAFSTEYVHPDRQEAFYYELISLKLAKCAEIPLRCLVRKDDIYKYFFDSTSYKDMADANTAFIANLSGTAEDANIHIGSGANFDALAKAGYKTLIVKIKSYRDMPLPALRGTSKAYKGIRYGAEIIPPDPFYIGKSLSSYRKYLISLYLAYIKGCDIISIRGNICGKYYADNLAFNNSKDIEHEFASFISSHTRRGSHYTGFGFMKGINEDLRLNQKGNVFGVRGKYWRASEAEKSWELLKTFYKGFSLGGVQNLCRKCSKKTFYATPYSEADIIPIGEGADNLNKYRYLVGIGGNTCNETLVSKWLDYVRNGGTLLIALPHLYTTDNRSQAIEHKSHILLNDDVRKLIGIDEIRRDGGVSINTARAVGARFGRSNERVFLNKIGKGRVYFVNEYAYPYARKRLYGRLITRLAREYAQLESERGFVRVSRNVSTSIFDAEDRRTIYMLDVRCRSKLKAHQRVKVSFAGKNYYVKVCKDVLNILTIFKDFAVLSADNTTDIISFRDGKLTLQGEGKVTLAILKGGHIRYRDIELRGMMTINNP